MVNKRGQNEGSIFKRKNGSWRAQISIQGNRISFNGKTKKDCLDWIRNTQNQIDIGMTFKDTKITLNEFMDDWLLSIEATLRPNTFKQYKQITYQHITPYLGNIKIIELQPASIQHRYNQMVKLGSGLRTVQITHAVIHRALVHAVKLGLIPRNPDDATNPPKPQKTEMQFYDQNQVQRFLIYTMITNDKYYPLYQLAISTGMRQGEILALKWSDLNWDRRTIGVNRQLTRAKDGGFEFSPPKTKAGIRTIALGVNTIKVLEEHQTNQSNEMSVAEDEWQDADLMFKSSKGNPCDRYNLLRSFKRSAKEAGLPIIRFHDLRHTAASLQLNNGIPVLVVSKRLGHSKSSITLDTYGHLIIDKQYEAADLMDELITPIPIEIPS